MCISSGNALFSHPAYFFPIYAVFTSFFRWYAIFHDARMYVQDIMQKVFEMNFDFENAVDRRGTASVKWNRNAIASVCGNPDADAFWVADMDFKAEPHIAETAERIRNIGVWGYPDFGTLYDSFVEWMKKKHDTVVGKDEIMFANGLLHALALCLQLFSKKGDRVLIPSPTYRPFRMITEDNEREIVDWPFPYGNGCYHFDWESFAEAAENVDVIMFCSPHNPSGLVFEREDLEFVLRFAKERNILVFSDEIHADLVHPGARHVPMHDANRKIGARCVSFMAPSKTFNIAGEHACFALFSDLEMLKVFRHAQHALRVAEPAYTVGCLTETAYRHGYEYNVELCRYLKSNADFIREYLEEYIPEMKLVNGRASFVTFIDCSEIYERVKAVVEGNPDKYHAGPDSGPLSLFFGVDAGVCMNNGKWFGDQYEAFVRFNYGTSRSEIEKALERMKKAVDSIR